MAIRDLTSSIACIGIWGPLARQIVQSTTSDEIGNGAFPYLTSIEMTVGLVPVGAIRVTYVGELGWEFYCPMEYLSLIHI